MTRGEAYKKMQEILREHGIELSIDACGCCDSPWVSFKYKDFEIDLEGDFGFSTDTTDPDVYFENLGCKDIELGANK